LKDQEQSIPTVTVDELARKYGIGSILPHEDVKQLSADLGNFGILLERSPEEFQEAAVQLTRRAADEIIARFGNRLDQDKHTLLAKIHEGVVVVKNLINLVPDIKSVLDLPTMPKIDVGIIEVSLKPIADVQGMVIKPYHAVLLDESTLSPKVSQDEQLSIVTHETWHVISDNNLPMLLDEAATDKLTERTWQSPGRSRYRMLWNYWIAYGVWQFVERITGEDAALQAYLEPGVIEETLDPSTEAVITTRIIDLDLHDRMREKLGNNWDRVIEATKKKRMIRSVGVLAVGNIQQRFKRAIRHGTSLI